MNPKNHNPFGVLAFLGWNHDWNNYKYPEGALEQAVELLAELGIGMVRLDFYWCDIEPEKDSFEFSKYDHLVSLLDAHGIEILGLLDFSVSWAADAWNAPPRNLDDYVSYAAATFKRYQNQVRYWEIWNEPDNPFYWNLQDNMATYTTMLKKTSATLRNIDPNCKILHGGLTGNGIPALEQIYDQGGGEAFDIVNFHPFVSPLNPGYLDTLSAMYGNIRKVLADRNDMKPIWFTEIGCPGVVTPSPANNWWEGQSPTDQQQAAFLKQAFSTLPTWDGLERIFWAFFRDCKEHFNSGADYLGLVRWDFSRKEAFEVYKDVIEKIKKQNERGNTAWRGYSELGPGSSPG